MGIPAFLAVATLFAAGLPAACLAGGLEDSRRGAIASYYPHWVARAGELTDEILGRLEPGTIIGAHHAWHIDEIRRVLEFPGKRFRIAWYAESNTLESDDPTAPGTPVAARIAEARRKQDLLAAVYGRHRFADLVELDASREKKDGALDGEGNQPADWLKDAQAVRNAGFRYIAKSPRPAHLVELRERFGDDFVPRVVFEDVTADADTENPGYREDARAIAAGGETVTLVIHEGAYGGFPATPLDRALAVLAADFAAAYVEAYWGRPDDFAKIKSIGETRLRPPPAELVSSARAAPPPGR